MLRGGEGDEGAAKGSGGRGRRRGARRVNKRGEESTKHWEKETDNKTWKRSEKMELE